LVETRVTPAGASSVDGETCKELEMTRYLKPNRFIAKVANPAVQFFIRRLGMSPAGAQLLEVRGRKSGNIHTVPVNPLEVDGHRYLVAPRGETQWVRNFRAAREGTLRVGKASERIVGRELPDGDKPAILRAYLDRYHWQVGAQFDAPKDASLEQLAGIAGNHPVFSIHAREFAGGG
jgi:deazaflavin-dependent oxidoreductase (nitroreductase family)